MKIRYDKEADALYIYTMPEVVDFRDPRYKKGVETSGEYPVALDFESDGRLRGIEILHASKVVDINYLKKLEFLER